MDALGIDIAVLGVTPPGTQPVPAAEAVPLCREANDLSAAAVAVHPGRLRALATLPTSDPDAAVEELERCTRTLGHVGVMLCGRTGGTPLDGPSFDVDVPPPPEGGEGEVDLRGAGLAALRLVLAGTFDRHPDLQLILGHWGEMLLFWLDRVDPSPSS